MVTFEHNWQPELPGLGPEVIVGHASTARESTRRKVGVSLLQLWRRSFELGGMLTECEMDESLRTGRRHDRHEHDILAVALDERLTEVGCDERIEVAKPDRRAHTTSSRQRPSNMHLELLGSFRLLRDGVPVRLAMNGQRLVTFLALHDRLLGRQHVAGSLWSDVTDRQASGSLRSTLWRLGDLTPCLVEISDARLRLATTVTVDLGASERLAHRILDRSCALGDDELDPEPLADDLLPDWTEDWVLERREQHAQLRVCALEALSQRLSEMGCAPSAVHAGMLAVAADPLRESAHRALIVAHLADGNLACAARQYQTIRAVLWDELGVEPSSETQALVADLRR
jgi:DNA-binding SARP family transcriptional activator